MPRKPRTPQLSPNQPAVYVAYYRVSSARQGESGLGLDAQRDAISRLARGGTILSEFTEVESGKSHTNRPQLLAALAEAKRRKATLLIAKLDRLARNVHFISGLMESGVEFRAADLPDASRLTLHFMAVLAEHERELISQRTYAGMEAAIREIEEKGFRISRRSGRPYSKHGNPRWQESIAKARASRKGAKPLPGVPSIAQPRQLAPDVLAILKSHKDQGKSLRQIAAAANALGLKTLSGAVWHASSVRAALAAGDGPAKERQDAA